MNLETIQLNRICRTCLTEKNDMRSVFTKGENYEGEMTLRDMLLSYAGIQISENDGLPDKVCEMCVCNINSAYSFKQLCLKADKTLRNNLVKHTSEFLPRLKSVGSSSQEVCMKSVDSIVPTCVNRSVKSKLKFKTSAPYGQSMEKDTIFQSETESIATSPIEERSMLKNGDNIDVKYKIELGNEGTSDTTSIISCNGSSQKIEFGEKKATEHSQNFTDTNKIGILNFCDICTKGFSTLKCLEDHSLEHMKENHSKKKYTCQKCQRTFSSASTLSRHVKVHGGTRKHLCNECGKGFLRSDDLTRHLRIHTGEKPYSCKTCSKSFAQSFRLLEHMRAHANGKTFKCLTCSKGFSRYTSLSAHAKTHLGIKTHACSICGKRLCGSGSLATHMKIHTGLRDHICSFCGKGFTTPSNLIIHRRTHTGEKPYVCSACGKAFPDPSRLTVHMRSHTGEKPYICDHCNHECASSSQLKRHIRIHTGEKPYKCELCPKAFPRSEELRVHKKTHTGLRDFICIHCNKGFYQASTLKVHLKIHTKQAY